MIINVTPRGQQAATADVSASLIDTYTCDSMSVWLAEYQKNLLNVHYQELSLFTDGTYILTDNSACMSNMDTDPVQGAPYDHSMDSRIVITGKYEKVTEPDDLGCMEIKLTSGEVKGVYGNMAMWPQEVEGERNFTLAIDGATVNVDGSTLTFDTPITAYEVAMPAA